MSLTQLGKFLLLIAALASAFIAGLIVLFDSVLSELANHSHQLAQLDPKLVSTTIVGVFGFMGVSAATRAVVHWARSRSPREETSQSPQKERQPTKTWAEAEIEE